MSRIFPRAQYAEDQQYSRTILVYHVLHRACQTGAVVGLAAGGIRYVLGRAPLPILSAGRGAIIGTALFIPGLPLYMRGKTDIEWQDRSWRLLENPGQVEVDDWSMAGLLVGTAMVVRREMGSQMRAGRWTRIAGGGAIGNLAGVTGYMLWRHGINGGKWPS